MSDKVLRLRCPHKTCTFFFLSFLLLLNPWDVQKILELYDLKKTFLDKFYMMKQSNKRVLSTSSSPMLPGTLKETKILKDCIKAETNLKEFFEVKMNH